MIPSWNLSASRLHFRVSATLQTCHFGVRYAVLTPVGRVKIWMKPQILTGMYLRTILDVRLEHSLLNANARRDS
jgi:hypothetical protein